MSESEGVSPYEYFLRIFFWFEGKGVFVRICHKYFNFNFFFKFSKILMKILSWSGSGVVSPYKFYLRILIWSESEVVFPYEFFLRILIWFESEGEFPYEFSLRILI